MLTRELVYAHCRAQLLAREQTLLAAIAELSAGAAGEGKSTAGDKHETARAMAQLEQEKLAAQLAGVRTLQQVANKLQATVGGTRIAPGHLIGTDRGWLYLSVALGKVLVHDVPVMVLSPQSPLGAKLIGAAAGDVVTVNTTAYRIVEVL